jgi:RhtB (resistance to homoserine/threonine) family protein
MEHYLLGLALVYIVFLGALMSPGPDFLMIMRNALGGSARAGIFAALGIAAGNVVHMAYCLAGIGLLITQSVLLFNIVKWIGAGYLVYIGIQSLRSKGLSNNAFPAKAGIRKNNEMSAFAGKTDKEAFIEGFITNLLNPKATMFFLALFSQMLDPALPFSLTLIFCGVCIVTVFTWFAAVALVMTMPAIRRAYVRASRWINRIFGGFFIALGLKLALTKV